MYGRTDYYRDTITIITIVYITLSVKTLNKSCNLGFKKGFNIYVIYYFCQ